MPQITWDEVGERRFETGVDHGVLYPLDGLAVPWNGLVAVNETKGGDIKIFYQDGVPYLVHEIVGAYAAKLQAFTYPDELDALTGGSGRMAEGIMLHNQRGALPFGLSYRTLLGNDSDGVDHGYKIHLLYNVIAVPSDFSYGTMDKSLNLTPMEWELHGIPPTEGSLARPTAHISVDSTKVDPDLLATLETMLYGGDEDPLLPSQAVLNSLTVGET